MMRWEYYEEWRWLRDDGWGPWQLSGLVRSVHTDAEAVADYEAQRSQNEGLTISQVRYVRRLVGEFVPVPGIELHQPIAVRLPAPTVPYGSNSWLTTTSPEQTRSMTETTVVVIPSDVDDPQMHGSLDVANLLDHPSDDTLDLWVVRAYQRYAMAAAARLEALGYEAVLSRHPGYSSGFENDVRYHQGRGRTVFDLGDTNGEWPIDMGASWAEALDQIRETIETEKE